MSWLFKKNINKLRQIGVYAENISLDSREGSSSIINLKAVNFQSSTFIIKYHSKEMYCIFFEVLYLQEVKGLYLSTLQIRTKPFSWWLSTLITHARPLENSCKKKYKNKKKGFQSNMKEINIVCLVNNISEKSVFFISCYTIHKLFRITFVLFLLCMYCIKEAFVP